MTAHAAPRESALPLVPDRWLGDQLGLAAFTLTADADPATPVPVRPAFVQTKVETTDVQRVDRLIRGGFTLVETAVILEASIDRTTAPLAAARFAVPADEADVRRIAGSAFTESRFHRDPLIPRERANAIKAAWAGNFFSGARGTHLVVAEQGGQTCGFLQLIERGKDLIIDLVGVDKAARGRGLGRAMLIHAARHIADPERWVVGTQLSNVRSLAFYNAFGFRIVRAHHSLHRHVRAA
jgi:ribosomal protein S18 acetylase RimI-like enzyme